MTDLTIILRSLKARLFSTITTALSVGVAAGLLLVLLSMRDAGEAAFKRGAGNMHLLVSRDASPLVSVLNGVFYANPPSRSIDWAKYQQIAQGYPIEFAIPTQQGDSYFGFPVMATTPEFFTKFQPDADQKWELASGRFLRDSDEADAAGMGVNKDAAKSAMKDAHAFEVVLGSAAARATKLRVGETLHLTHGISQSRQLGAQDAMQPHVHKEFTYTVVGVLKPTGTPHDSAVFSHLDGGWVIHAHDRRRNADPSITTTTLADLTDADRLITGIYLRVLTRPGQQATASLAPVFDGLRRDASITVAQPVQQINTLFRIVGNIDWILKAMALVVLVSSGVGILLALYNSMNERRRQIAVLRVLGCSQGRVFRMVVTESAIIGMCGALIGVVGALLGLGIVAQVLRREVGINLPAGIGLDWTLSVVLGTIALAALAGLIPAIMAYRTPVVNNLKPMG